MTVQSKGKGQAHQIGVEIFDVFIHHLGNVLVFCRHAGGYPRDQMLGMRAESKLNSCAWREF
jgi:hypothetical protein